jgi:2-methylcitrate dehydratase PrpD
MTDTHIRRLARFVSELEIDDLPDSVVERVRLQHLSAAGALRELRGSAGAAALHTSAGSRGRARKVTGGTASARAALRLHSCLLSAWAWEDSIFSGPASAGGVCTSWALAKGRSVDDVLLATAAANEVVGRVGAAELMNGPHSERGLRLHSLGSAVAAGKLQGLKTDALAHALALALSSPVSPAGGTTGLAYGGAVADAVAFGFDSVDQAKKGVHGPVGLLDESAGTLSAAFTGLGSVWLTATISYKQLPGPMAWQAPLQAVRQILRRHIKAADKRLRSDQVERVEIGLPMTAFSLVRPQGSPAVDEPWSLPWDLRCAVATLICEHSLDKKMHLDGAWERLSPTVQALAGRVHIHHDWQLSLAHLRHNAEVWAPLLAGVRPSECWAMGRRVVSGGLGLGRPSPRMVLEMLRARPDRLLEGFRSGSGDLSDVRLAEWQVRHGARVKVFTTRGGTWPEDRTIPEDSPGWSWIQTRQDVVAKHALDEDKQDASSALLDVAGSVPADQWVQDLLG